MLCIWLSHLERNFSKVLTFNKRQALLIHRHKSLFGDEKRLISWDYLFSWHTGLLSAFYPCQTPRIRLFVSWLIYRCLFIYILCFFWCLAWCATLCFVNGFRPRAAVNDMVVIVCQCDNVRVPISMWSWTFDEGGIVSGRQSVVICHQLNELLSRHPLVFHWQYYIAYCMKEPLLRSNQEWHKSFMELLRLCLVLTYRNLLTVFHGKTEVKLQSVVIFYS